MIKLYKYYFNIIIKFIMRNKLHQLILEDKKYNSYQKYIT